MRNVHNMAQVPRVNRVYEPLSDTLGGTMDGQSKDCDIHRPICVYISFNFKKQLLKTTSTQSQPCSSSWPFPTPANMNRDVKGE